MLENTMTLSAESLTIPAGQLASEEATLTIDPAFLAITDEQKTYDPAVFTVTVGELKTSCNDVRLSTKTNKVTVTYKKTVKPYLNLASGTPSNAEYMDRTNWSGTLGEGVENVIGNIFDGNTGSDIAANSAPWEFTLDLGAETTMLGRIQDTGEVVMLRGRSKFLLRRTTRRGNRMVRSRYPAVRRTGGS